MALYKITHSTKYVYSDDVFDSINQMLLYPINDGGQSIINHVVEINNSPHTETFTDKFGNKLGIFSIINPHRELHITSNLTIKTNPIYQPNQLDDVPVLWDKYQACASDFQYKDFLYIDHSKDLEQILSLVENMKDLNLSPLDNAKKFSTYIFENFTYKQGVTSIETNIDEIWSLKAGVCQDFAHFLLIMLRIIGLPARYVSGYICPNNDEWRGIGATHAWVEVYIPDYGWLGLDPTNNCIVSDRHVRLAIGRDFKDCTPVKGSYKGSLDHRLEVSVVVENMDVESEYHLNNKFTDHAQIVPTFVSEVKSPSDKTLNSYQAFIQQQQQQQQQ